MTILAQKLSCTFMEIENQMQNHKIETNSELMCFQDLSDPRFLLIILKWCEKLIREMNLDLYLVIEFIFST